MDRKNPSNMPGPSGLSGTRPKVNIWQQVDEEGEMDAPDVHNLVHENLHLDGVRVYDQHSLEQGIMDEMNDALNQRQRALEVKRATREIKRIEIDIREVTFNIKQADKTLEIVSIQSSDKDTRKRLESVKCQKANKEKQLKTLQAKLKRLQKVAGIIPSNATEDEIPLEDVEKAASSSATWALTGKGEEERERLIKLGHMTPFGTVIAEEEKEQQKAPQKRKLFLDGGFNDFLTSQEKPKKVVDKRKTKKLPTSIEKSFKIPKKKTNDLKSWIGGSDDQSTNFVSSSSTDSPRKSIAEESNKESTDATSDEEYIPDQEDVSRADVEELEYEELAGELVPERKRKKQPRYDSATGLPVFDYDDETDAAMSKKARLKKASRTVDDGKLANYKKRILKYQAKLDQEEAEGVEVPDDKDLGNDFKVPGRIWSRLYKYQRTGVRWLCELHSQRVGGILGDEMGLGKTIQAQLVDKIARSKGVLITSYERARISTDMLLEQGWHYVILDEGHKIRNPDAAVTVALKLFCTPHRLILSGSPVQNNLRELWSLFDFIFPGKLGTLPVFLEQFSIPIVQGGYSNASEIQVHTAYKCACKLRDTISPYLLRRMKRDVQLSLELPSKNEQVLFCRLTDDQVEVYKKYLDSDQVHSILTREMKVFAGLIQLRKICNHPDLYTGGPKIMVGEETPSPHDKRSFGFYKRSGKMLVISSLLKIWKKQGHKVLLFTQSKAMLDILEIFVSSRGYSYLTMHGGTPVQTRQPLVLRFNTDPSLFVFVLTTRVGGLGVNLTGANRVIIYDPDWNPSTDSQAQERAWRIGQKRDVTIYRLLTSGTIEEKIYHRQIFKQFLTNRILKDPWQRRFFKSNDLHELFILKDYLGENSSESRDGHDNCKTETAAIFAGTGSEVKPSLVRRNKSLKKLDKVTMKDGLSRSNSEKRSQKNDPIPESSVNSRELPVPSITNISDKNKHKKSDISVPHGSTDKEGEKSEDKNLFHEDQNLFRSEISAARSPAADQNARRHSDGISEQSSDLNCGTASIESRCSKHMDISSAGSKSSSLKESLLRAKEKFEKKKLAEKAELKEKKNKKKAKKKPVVDGEVVKNVTGIEDYKPQKPSAVDIEEKSQKESDDYVLHKLFKRGGVHSALQHNTIMNSGLPDYALVEVEAERVAKESVRNLRLSRKKYQYPTARKSSDIKPRFGSETVTKIVEKDDSAMAKAEEQNVFKASLMNVENDNSGSDSEEGSSNSNSPTPLSASQLLSMMRRRNHEEIHKQEEEDSAQVEEESDLFGFAVSQSTSGGDTAVNPTEHDGMLVELRDFIAFQCRVDGQASTSEIMAEFGTKVKPSHAAVFKSILKQLCTSEKSPNSEENIWFLKPEFR